MYTNDVHYPVIVAGELEPQHRRQMLVGKPGGGLMSIGKQQLKDVGKVWKGDW